MPYTLVTQPPGHENYQEIDFSSGLTKSFMNRFFGFSSFGLTPNTPATANLMVSGTTYYLKDEKGAQGLYIPVGFNGVLVIKGALASTTGTGVYSLGNNVITVSRDDSNFFINGATSAVTVGAAGAISGESAGNFTVQITRNTTVNAVEFTVVKATNNSTGTVKGLLQIDILNVPFFTECNNALMRTLGTAALTVAE